MAERDWAAIAAEYIAGEASLRALAQKHAIPRSTLYDRARRGGWDTLRLDRRAARLLAARGAEGAAGEKAAAEEREEERIFRVTDKLVRRAEEILDGEDAVGARELGELMRAIKNAKEIKMLRSALDEREQLARVRALEEKSESAAAEPLRIEFSPEAAEAAR